MPATFRYKNGSEAAAFTAICPVGKSKATRIQQPPKLMYNRECQRTTRLYLFLFLLVGSLFLAACGSTAKYLAKGEEYLKKRKFHDAMMQFRAAAEADSGSAQGHWGLARAYENLGQFNDVVDELRKAVELDDTN